MSSTSAPTVSVIVPVYKGGDHFKHCLASVCALEPQPLEIIVVADGDPDGSADHAEARGARVVRLEGPSGPARARNAGARQAEGELLFFVDADVTVSTDVVARIQALFEHNAGLSAVIGSYDDAPADMRFLSQYRNLLHHYVHQRASEQAWTFWGACGAIRRSVFDTVGGFDVRYRRPSVEDIELGYRLRRAGYEIRLCKSLVVKHLKRWTLSGMIRTDVFDRALPWTDLILAHRDLPNDLNLNVAARWSGAMILSFGLSILVLPWVPESAWVGASSLLGLLLLNADVYRFLWRERGFLFMLRSIPLHGFYYLYSSLAFALGVARHIGLTRLGRRLPRWAGRKSPRGVQQEGNE